MNELTFTASTLTTAAISTGKPAYDAILARIALPLTYGDVVKHIQALAATHAPRTVNLHKAALKKAVSMTTTNFQELAALNAAFKTIKTVKVNPVIHAEKLLTADKLAALMAGATPRRKVIIQALEKTGLRIAELAGIRLSDCTLAGDVVNVRVIGKGKKERRVFLPVSLYREIRDLYKGKKYLFEAAHGNAITTRYLRLAIQAAGEKAGLKNIHPHMLRHTFATKKIVTEKKSLKAVSLYLGHASTSTTADMYVHDELTPQDCLC